MTKILLLLLSAAQIAGAAPAAKPDLQAELDSLVASERAFSKTSEESGIKPAFLAFMADDSILFRPGPVLGKPWTEERPNPPALLTWYPVKADIAKSGELGYTTGPWELRPKGKDDTTVVHGNYVTLWKKRADGSWKLVTDIGNVNPPPAGKPAEALRVDALEIESRGGTGDAEAEGALLAADRSFGKDVQSKGAPAAYSNVLAHDSRILRMGAAPVIGKDTVRGFLTDRKVTMSWEPERAETSNAGDFGYTYGTYEETSTGAELKVEKGYYLRIWEKQGGDNWKVVLEVTSPPPPPPSKPQ